MHRIRRVRGKDIYRFSGAVPGTVLVSPVVV
jgi:hypothetical protein